MKVGFTGLGKMGLPVAVTMAMRGHDVIGYDIDPRLMNKDPRPYLETGPDGQSPFNPILAKSNIRFGGLDEIAGHAEIIFVAVQTPHDPAFEGITRLPADRVDFDYSHLTRAIADLAGVITRETLVVIMSTVLPGSLAKYIRPVITEHIRLCYSPSFIAMGTAMRDFLDPEFVIFGALDEPSFRAMEAFYATVTGAPFHPMSVENAELVKVAYNTFIGMKIAFANTMMEICHKMPGTDVDVVTNVLGMARQRLMSPTYFSGGMGDGGGCHPRDNIALSWLARELGLSHDIFEDLMVAREHQTEFLADLMCAHDLPKAILGYAYKPETNLCTGSPALLLKSILEERGHEVFVHDPHVEDGEISLLERQASVFLIGAKHPEFTAYEFPAGSVVIDPWRYIPTNQPGVTVIPLGKRAHDPAPTPPS